MFIFMIKIHNLNHKLITFYLKKLQNRG